MGNVDLDRIERIERKIKALEEWAARVAPVIKAFQQARKPGESESDLFSRLFGKK